MTTNRRKILMMLSAISGFMGLSKAQEIYRSNGFFTGMTPIKVMLDLEQWKDSEIVFTIKHRDGEVSFSKAEIWEAMKPEVKP